MVEQRDPIVTGGADAGISRCGNVLSGFDDHGGTHFPGDLNRTIGAVIIDDDNLIDLHGLSADAVERFPDKTFGIIRRNDDRNSSSGDTANLLKIFQYSIESPSENRRLKKMIEGLNLLSDY